MSNNKKAKTNKNERRKREKKNKIRKETRRVYNNLYRDHRLKIILSNLIIWKKWEREKEL